MEIQIARDTKVNNELDTRFEESNVEIEIARDAKVNNILYL